MAERLLRVIASPRKERSRSEAVADILLQAIRERRPNVEIETLDLWTEALPSLGGDMIEGRYRLIHGQPVGEELEAAWQEIREHADHFLSFDTWLIATPMWNFGLPYRLKHWIDVVTQPGMAFTNDASGSVIGHGAGKRALLVAAGALDIRTGGALAHLDFQLSYLRAWLGFIGTKDIHELKVSPTFGATGDVEKAMAEAAAEARILAARLYPAEGA